MFVPWKWNLIKNPGAGCFCCCFSFLREAIASAQEGLLMFSHLSPPARGDWSRLGTAPARDPGRPWETQYLVWCVVQPPRQRQLPLILADFKAAVSLCSRNSKKRKAWMSGCVYRWWRLRTIQLHSIQFNQQLSRSLRQEAGQEGRECHPKEDSSPGQNTCGTVQVTQGKRGKSPQG